MTVEPAPFVRLQEIRTRLAFPLPPGLPALNHARNDVRWLLAELDNHECPIPHRGSTGPGARSTDPATTSHGGDGDAIPRAGTQKANVLAIMGDGLPRTAAEIQIEMGMDRFGPCGWKRVSELVGRRWLVDTGKTRISAASGSEQREVVISDEGREALRYIAAAAAERDRRAADALHARTERARAREEKRQAKREGGS